jgi:NADH dehydrogenase [ubiquinone] 1 alpha subcomplex assembly factor 5
MAFALPSRMDGSGAGRELATAGWQSRKVLPEAPHMDSMLVFDRDAVRLHRDRAARTVGSVADLLRDGAERLLGRLDDMTGGFGQALEIGGRGVVAPLLRARGIAVVSGDLSEPMARLNHVAVVADEECLPFGPESFDLVVASLSLHWINDLPGALIQIRRTLRPDGLFLASMPTLGSLGELRTALTEAELTLCGGASPRVSPFPDLRDCAGLLQRAGFAAPVAELEEIIVRYADPLRLLRDMRAAGETNAVRARARTAPPAELFPSAMAGMREADGRVPVTMRLAMMTGWVARQ